MNSFSACRPRMSRRAVFLLFTVIACASAIAAARSPRIVIIGAGASGIAAASKLLENGFDDVLVLEAENRIGGRVHTIDFAGYKIDLGAQWIHGEVGNVVYELVAPLNITDHSDQFETEVYTSNGELFEPTIAKNLTDTYNNYLDIAEDVTSDCHSSLGECFERKLSECFKWFPELNDTAKDQFLWLFNMMQVSLDPADNWYGVATAEYSEYDICGGDRAMNWMERTYGTILDILMKRFPNPEEELPVLNKTIVNAEVTRLDYTSDDNNVKVKTLDGKEYVADHVIMTPSLGVLKERHESLFDPPLSESKVRNIKGLGYGSACKIYLAFNDNWFNPLGKKNGGYLALFSSEERKRLDSNPNTKWLPYALGFFFVEHKPNLMYVWVSGKGASLMQNVPDEEVFAQTEQLLFNMLSNHYNVSKPVQMIRSKWYENKHFRGTYSYVGIDTVKTNSSAKQLSEPITKMGKPIILFGGEATSEQHFSTVHGAVESGWREAVRLIDLYRGKDTTESAAAD